MATPKHSQAVAESNRRRATHGMSKHPLFAVWWAMMDRCVNPRSKFFGNYGGRGISVCESWLKFEHFYADMGDRPDGATLERKDNSKGYCHENCKWADRIEQANNKRNNRLITAFGKTQTLAQWARELEGKVHITTISRRLNRGLAPEKALS